MKEEEKLIYLYESYKSLLLKITFQILNDEYLAEDAVPLKKKTARPRIIYGILTGSYSR